MATSAIVGTSQTLSIIYEWKIQNYSSYSDLKQGKSVVSPVFYVQERPWHLEIFPNGNFSASENFASLFLYLDSKDAPIKAQYAFSIFDSKKNMIAEFHKRELSSFDKFGKGKANLVKNSLITTAPSDNITIMCEIITEQVVVDKTLLVISSAKVTTFKAFENYFNNAQFSDVKLIAENKEMFAHKMVLAANSRVFAAMFNHEMRENKNSTVIIEDIKYEVFCELLRFMYTGESSLTEDIASELLKASDKYELLKLKDMCEKKICKNLSMNNVIECLHLSDMYNAQSLKKEAIDFFAFHGQKMIDQPEFDSLRSLHPDLFKEVFRSVFARLNVPDLDVIM